MIDQARALVEQSIADLSEAEAVAYLLDMMFPKPSAKAQLYNHFSVHVAPSVADTLRTLTLWPELCVEHEALAFRSRWPLDSDQCAADYTNTRIKNLRKVIAQQNWPIKIEAIQCIGYAAHITDPAFQLPWSQNNQSLEPKQ